MSFKSIYIPVLAVVLLVSILPSCYYDNEEELYGGPIECDTINVTYSNQIQPIIQNNCATTGCHVLGGTGNGIYDSYDALKAKVDNGSLQLRVVDDRNMPPSGSLLECQIQKIEKWIEQGAPEG